MKLKPLKYLLIFMSLNCFGQNKEDVILKKYESFSLYYGFSGLGSNMGKKFPTLRIQGTKFIYTNEQNSSYGEPDLKPDTICLGTIRTSSIDSIINLVKDVKEKEIHKYNNCIMSGGIYNMNIKYMKHSVGYSMMNTFDWIPLRIVRILNPYLPTDEKIWATEELIKDEEKCK